MEILSTILDSSSNRAAVEIRTTGKTKSTGQSIDNVACWLMTVDGEGAGQLSEVSGDLSGVLTSGVASGGR